MLAETLGRLEPAEIVAAVAYLTGTTPSGRIGVGWSTLAAVRVSAASEPTLTISEVDVAIFEVAQMAGPGVQAARRGRLMRLMERAMGREQELLVAVIGGELRQGALDGVMTSAIAKAAKTSVAAVRHAAMMTGELTEAARLALTGGSAALEAVTMTPLRPVLPMLASPAVDIATRSTGSAKPRSNGNWMVLGYRLIVGENWCDCSLEICMT